MPIGQGKIVHILFFSQSLKFGIVKVGETCSSEAVLNTKFS